MTTAENEKMVGAKTEMTMSIEELIEKPYWIVDILPKQVPADAGGQYFKVEKYYLERLPLIRRKYAGLLRKLNCYFDMEMSRDCEEWVGNPEPAAFDQWADDNGSEASLAVSLSVILKPVDTLMVMERDSTFMTVYNLTEEVLEIIRQLAAAEGLFVWQPED